MEKRPEQDSSPDEPWREVPEADDQRDPRLVEYIDDSEGSEEEGNWRGASAWGIETGGLWPEKYDNVNAIGALAADDPELRAIYAKSRLADLMADATPAQRAILTELLSLLRKDRKGKKPVHGLFTKVARRLGISPGTVRAQLFRLRGRAQK